MDRVEPRFAIASRASVQKCDGNQPVCNQCLRFNRSAECEFSEAPEPSTSKVLEQHISQLQTRIQELEQDPNSIRLHDPYIAPESGGGQSIALVPPTANWWETPEPPAHVVKILSVASPSIR